MTPIDRFTGFLYRALNPVYARDPLSGRGAQLYGGRFNPKGTPALYASLSPMTALREANQVGTLQPTTLVAYDADIRPVFDTRDTGSLAGFDMSPSSLSDTGFPGGETRRDVAAARLPGRSVFSDRGVIAPVDGRVMSFCVCAAPGS